MNRPETSAVKELIIKNWMTHDAMWFFHSMNEIGIETTNKINRQAVRSMSVIEIKRLKKLYGVSSIETFEEFADFFPRAFETILGEFMELEYSFPEHNRLHGEWKQNRCFAYQGIKNIGVIDQYKCGIFQRIEGWFEGLGIKYTVEPKVTTCIMHTNGRCYQDYQFFFK
ncbi:MAG: hypothetical protein JW885_02460 [Deltaproteobacteria bacterium]|nr:hypothetical protein [Candidatus Zymogenaceae bacterium]